MSDTMDTVEERRFLEVVRQLHKRVGYGRMIQIVSHEWYRSDPIGALVNISAYGLLEGEQRVQAEEAAHFDPLFTNKRTSTPVPIPTEVYAHQQEAFNVAETLLDHSVLYLGLAIADLQFDERRRVRVFVRTIYPSADMSIQDGQASHSHCVHLVTLIQSTPILDLALALSHLNPYDLALVGRLPQQAETIYRKISEGKPDHEDDGEQDDTEGTEG